MVIKKNVGQILTVLKLPLRNVDHLRKSLKNMALTMKNILLSLCIMVWRRSKSWDVIAFIFHHHNQTTDLQRSLLPWCAYVYGSWYSTPMYDKSRNPSMTTKTNIYYILVVDFVWSFGLLRSGAYFSIGPNREGLSIPQLLVLLRSLKAITHRWRQHRPCATEVNRTRLLSTNGYRLLNESRYIYLYSMFKFIIKYHTGHCISLSATCFNWSKLWVVLHINICNISISNVDNLCEYNKELSYVFSFQIPKF